MDEARLQELADILARHGCGDEVIRHCRAVTDLALRIADRIPGADRELVAAGAMLHDLGRSVTHGMRHALEGARLAAALGQPPAVTAIIRNHIGAGLTAAEAARAGLPAEDFLPRTLESRIVAHADNLVAGDRRQTADALARHLAAKGLAPAAERVRALHRDLSALAGIDLDLI